MSKHRLLTLITNLARHGDYGQIIATNTFASSQQDRLVCSQESQCISTEKSTISRVSYPFCRAPNSAAGQLLKSVRGEFLGRTPSASEIKNRKSLNLDWFPFTRCDPILYYSLGRQGEQRPRQICCLAAVD